MIDLDGSRAELTRFLARKGRDLNDLTDQIAMSFGDPQLVIAAGSVQQGFGNEESDVDLIVFVDAQVTNVPISSHVLGLPVDINYLSTSWADTVDQLLTTAGYDGDLKTREQWKDSLRRFQRLGRLAVSLPLSGTPQWLDWQAGLAARTTGYAVHWWTRECLRQRTAARLLRSQDPRLAAQRYCDAGLAALEVVAAQVGELYVGAKWIQAKLARGAAAEHQESYRLLMRTPVTEAEAEDYCDLTEKLLLQIVTEVSSIPLSDDPSIALSLMPDVERMQVRGRTLLHRWGVRGVETRDQSLAEPGADGAFWHGPASGLPADAALLVDQGLVWLSVTESVTGSVPGSVTGSVAGQGVVV